MIFIDLSSLLRSVIQGTIFVMFRLYRHSWMELTTSALELFILQIRRLEQERNPNNLFLINSTLFYVLSPDCSHRELSTSSHRSLMKSLAEIYIELTVVHYNCTMALEVKKNSLRSHLLLNNADLLSSFFPGGD